MCFSVLQVSRCVTLPTNSWYNFFNNYRNTSKNVSSIRVFTSRAGGLEDKNRKKWTRRTLNTKAEGTKKVTSISKSGNIITDEVSETKVNIKNSEINEFRNIGICDIKPKTSESRDLTGPVTVFVFDIETTGFSRENERIIEIALMDIAGGENSTFETLVNPERYVANSHIHCISTHKVNRPDVPRMIELIPILLQYARSRQKPGGRVLWVAHNARSFDVPFLVNEFRRCGFDIPQEWMFLDTLPLGRKIRNLSESTLGTKTTLQALRDYYDIKIDGSPHRAMYDVKVLSKVLQKLTYDLKLPISGLIEESFSVSDLPISKKKNRD